MHHVLLLRSPLLCAAVCVLTLTLTAGTATAQSGSRASAPPSVADRAAAIASGSAPARHAFDFNPDPDVVEVVLVASVHRTRLARRGPRTEVWSYNGITPGPRIEAEVGNTLVVHFFNFLPEETTVHWHGVEVPATMDGTPLSQAAVPPGGYFRYEFPVDRASLYWYHPHFDTNEQIERGLYGSLLVHDSAANDALELPSHETVLMLDDVLLDESNQIVPPGSDDPLENAAVQLNGREGNVMLVNGREGATMRVRRGQPQRLRVVNAANSRFMRISIEGHSVWRIGGDAGLLEAPVEILPIEGPGDLNPDHGLILTPGERADLIFTPSGSHSFDLMWYDWERGRHSTFYMDSGGIGVGDAEDDGARPPQSLMRFRPFGRHSNSTYTPPSVLRDITPIDVNGATPLLSVFGHTPPNATGDVTFFVQMKDGMPLPFPLVTPEDAPEVAVGERVIWNVANLTGGDHNFHLHGFFFQPLEVEYIDMDNPANNYVEPFPYLEEKDTVRLPKRPGARMRSRTVTRVAVHFDDAGREGQITASGGTAGAGTSGGWMFHCHINEHSDRGMMSYLQVVDDPGVVAALPQARTGATPSTFGLEANYPNPFHSATTIRFSILGASDVALRVYDVLGREVATLLDGLQEAGTHEVQWDASALPSGTYIYRLNAGGEQSARQLVVQR